MWPPKRTHALDQYMALALDVQARLAPHRTSLVEAGWSEREAYALCLRVEERILGPAMDMAALADRIERTLDEMVREELGRRT